MKDILADLVSAHEHLAKASLIIDSVNMGNPAVIAASKALVATEESLEKKIIDLLLLLHKVCAELTPTPTISAMPKRVAISDFCRKMKVSVEGRNVYFFERNASFPHFELCIYSEKDGCLKANTLVVAVRLWPRSEIISFIEATAARIKQEIDNRKSKINLTSLHAATKAVLEIVPA